MFFRVYVVQQFVFNKFHDPELQKKNNLKASHVLSYKFIRFL